MTVYHRVAYTLDFNVRVSKMNPPSGACVLLFSGGRDSTISAIKLSAFFERLILVTVTSQHLVGMDAVY
jgi:hypothetical protein